MWLHEPHHKSHNSCTFEHLISVCIPIASLIKSIGNLTDLMNIHKLLQFLCYFFVYCTAFIKVCVLLEHFREPVYK